MGVCNFDGPTIINGFKTEMTLIKQLNMVDRKKLKELLLICYVIKFFCRTCHHNFEKQKANHREFRIDQFAFKIKLYHFKTKISM